MAKLFQSYRTAADVLPAPDIGYGFAVTLMQTFPPVIPWGRGRRRPRKSK
jgi:hypothetical protein